MLRHAIAMRRSPAGLKQDNKNRFMSQTTTPPRKTFRIVKFEVGYRTGLIAVAVIVASASSIYGTSQFTNGGGEENASHFLIAATYVKEQRRKERQQALEAKKEEWNNTKAEWMDSLSSATAKASSWMDKAKSSANTDTDTNRAEESTVVQSQATKLDKAKQQWQELKSVIRRD